MRNLRLSPVLDVGCAQGMLAHLVKDSGLTLDGVEYNPEWADLARPSYRNVWSGAIENAPLPDDEYRLVVCGDVLEHTPDPVAVLRRLKRAARPDATFIISVPNIAHVGVRVMLLFGLFPKMERGPLDKTHLQFFTKDTAKQMVESAGLKVKRITCTGVPLDEVWKDGQGALYKVATKLQHGALSVAPRLFGFQWIMVAQPEGAGDAPADGRPPPTAPNRRTARGQRSPSPSPRPRSGRRYKSATGNTPPTRLGRSASSPSPWRAQLRASSSLFAAPCAPRRTDSSTSSFAASWLFNSRNCSPTALTRPNTLTSAKTRADSSTSTAAASRSWPPSRWRRRLRGCFTTSESRAALPPVR